MVRPFNPTLSNESSYLNEQYLDNQDYIVLPSSNQIARRVTLFDSNGNEILSGAGSSIVSGNKRSTSPGTAVQVNSSSISIKGVWISADLGNNGPIVVGDSSCIATLGANKGIPLSVGSNPIYLPINNINVLYMDVQISGDKLSYAYLV